MLILSEQSFFYLLLHGYHGYHVFSAGAKAALLLLYMCQNSQKHTRLQKVQDGDAYPLGEYANHPEKKKIESEV